ncbi:nuclear transport factor 2 [Forsythia ovata]|uniref:Nuclear transport factor 2 n=1 Tax=Forsythia ovata TaxID=205694 RepID=A0ABD1QC49_9LAMI
MKRSIGMVHQFENRIVYGSWGLSCLWWGVSVVLNTATAAVNFSVGGDGQCWLKNWFGRSGIKMEEQVEMVGRSFVDHYYHLFDNDRCLLASLYRPTSVLTFEGQKTQGVHDISIKLSELPFGQCLHVISTIDSQPSAFAGGVLVFVSGSIQLLGEDYPLRFSQMFHLIPTEEGSFIPTSA